MIDFCSTDGAVVLEEDVDLIMQQIEILFDTRNGDVLGAYNYGTRFDTYLFNTNIGNMMIEAEVTNYIKQNVELFGWDVSVKVSFLMGTMNDIMLMDVTFYNDKVSYTKSYKFDQGPVKYL